MTTIASTANAKSRRFTADEVLRMVELGVIREDERVELLEGELVVVTPAGPSHAGLCTAIAELLGEALHQGAHVRQQMPFVAEPESLPEPDLAIVRGRPRDWLRAHPRGKDLLLVVEVAVTSQALDRAKAVLYARAGVATYWLVDVPARQVVVHGNVDADGRYASVTVLVEADSIELPGLGASWSVADLLP